MNGKIPEMGPEDESSDSVLERLAYEDISKGAEISGLDLSLDDVFVPLVDEELKEGHPALETLGTILESVQAHMQYFQVDGADKITVDQIQMLEPSVYHNPLELEDLVLIVKDELNQLDLDSPRPTKLTFEHIIEASNRVDIKSKLDEETQKAITNLAIRLFGQEQENKIFRKAIESPMLARKIRRFSWVLNQPFMKEFPDMVRREIALRNYENRMAGSSIPASMSFPEVLLLAYRTLKGMKVELDNELPNINPLDYYQLINNRMLFTDVLRAIAVIETVANTDI